MVLTSPIFTIFMRDKILATMADNGYFYLKDGTNLGDNKRLKNYILMRESDYYGNILKTKEEISYYRRKCGICLLAMVGCCLVGVIALLYSLIWESFIFPYFGIPLSLAIFYTIGVCNKHEASLYVNIDLKEN